MQEGLAPEDQGGVTAVSSDNKQEEKLVPQSIVDKVIGREKEAAFERGKQQALRELQERQSTAMPPPSANPQSLQDAAGVTSDDVRKMIAEQYNTLYQENIRNQREEQAVQIAEEFYGKLDAAKKQNPEFEEKVINRLDFANMPELVFMINKQENAVDILQDIAESGHKLASLINLSQTQRGVAEAEIKKLSDSLKRNKEAAAQTMPDEPLSTIRSSTIGMDNGVRSVQDFSKASWARG